MKVILHLTLACNLRCRYCYAPRQSHERMSLETGRKAIDLVAGLGDGSFCVSFFGGEPLLMFDEIVQLVDFAERRGAELGKKACFRLSTNGTLFTEERLRFCRQHAVYFAVSLDGDREAHDAQRIFPDGRGSFDELDAKLAMMLEYNPYAVVTSVVTPPTVDRLRDSIEYMWEKGLRYFAHQPDYTHPDWTPQLLQRLERSYRQLAEFYLEKARSGEYFHFSLFDDKLASHADSPVQLGQTCDFGARKVSVAPDGRIFPCVQFVSDKPDAEDYCIGHVDSGFTSRREALIQRNLRPREQCEGCALLGRCANFCGCMNWQTTGDITTVPGILCAHERMLIPIVDELGNEMWNERNRHFLQKHYREFEMRFEYRVD